MASVPLLAALVIAAATSSRPVLDALRPELEKAAGGAVEIRYGATGALAALIRKGAAVDLFLAADDEMIRRLALDGFVEEGSASRCSVGSLAVVSAVDAPFDLPRRLDGATALAFVKLPIRKLAIPDPDSSPEGVAARQVLVASRVFQELKERLLPVAGADEAIAAVRAGEADAAIVPASLAPASGLKWRPVDSTLHKPLRMTAAVAAASEQKDAARHALAVLTAPASREAWKRAGFSAP
jgi:molybdate transport system substrate-binding protein